MFRLTYFGLILGLGLPLAAQTQVDLRTQSRGVDFQAAPYTRPLKTAASLPLTCTQNELVFLTTAPAGSNIYACMAGTWVAEAGGQEWRSRTAGCLSGRAERRTSCRAWECSI
jgi:hypothetical protein